MSILIPDIPNHDQNIFGCITIPTEIVMPAKEVPIIDYLIKDYPRNENTNPFTFVYRLFDYQENAFGAHQSDILSVSSFLFSDIQPLDEFEMSVLNKTFLSSIKATPTLKGRK
jgi:hypothetical protein